MGRIRLELPVASWQEFADEQGVRAHYGWMRLGGLLYIGQGNWRRDCLIDTGAGLSVLPESEWRVFEDEVEWLTAPATPSRSDWWLRIRGLTGDPIPCRIGRILVAPADLDGRRLAATSVIAQFVEDGGRIRRILMGLGHGILEGRRLIVEPDLRQAWLEDR